MTGKILDVSKFRTVRDNDLTNITHEIASSLTTWVGGMEHRGVGREFTSTSDLLSYYDVWDIWETLPTLVDPDPTLVEASRIVTQQTYNALDRPKDHRSHDSTPLPVDFLNAEDFMFQNPYPLPAHRRPRRILDFGSGSGRQVNIWSQRVDDLVYCSMDAIEMAYVAQHFHYSNVPGHTQYEYISNPETFAIADSKGIYHLPTWRWDLLPENFFDLIIGVQVFPELDEPLITHLYDLFAKLLVPGGALYIRDHGLDSFFAHDVDVEAALADKGFILEYRPYVKDFVDMHGIPRIWRKLSSDIS